MQDYLEVCLNGFHGIYSQLSAPQIAALVMANMFRGSQWEVVMTNVWWIKRDIVLNLWQQNQQGFLWQLKD